MPTSSTSSNQKQPEPRYQITPESFKKLHPVHYQIFEILKDEVPVTLIQTCREVYDELVPELYHRLVVTGANYDQITHGATINPSGESDSEDEDESCDGDSSSSVHSPTNRRQLPDLKNEALSHTTYLSFSDIECALAFTKDSDLCCWCLECQYKYTLDGVLFPSVNHLHLGYSLVCLLAELEFLGDEPERRDVDTHRICEFLGCLWEHCQPHTVCLEWPQDWDEEVGRGYESEDDEENWKIKEGMNDLIISIIRPNFIKRLVLHMKVEDFDKVKFDLNEITKHTSFTFYLTKDPKTTTTQVINILWKHFKSVPKQGRVNPTSFDFQYSLPPSSKSYSKAVDRMEKDRKQEDMDLFAGFKKRLEWDGSACECCEEE